MSGYIIELEAGVWLDPYGGGRVGRTLVQRNARRYKTEAAAKAALTRARKDSPFLTAQVIPVAR